MTNLLTALVCMTIFCGFWYMLHKIFDGTLARKFRPSYNDIEGESRASLLKMRKIEREEDYE